MTLDELITKQYDKDTYNCAHFVCDVWRVWYGDQLAHTLECFLLSHYDRYADPSIRRQFKLLKNGDWFEKGDIAVLHQTKGNPHVAVFSQEGFMQITKYGVNILNWDMLQLGFHRSKVYRHVR